MYDFTDLNAFWKAVVLILTAAALVAVVPLASIVFLFLHKGYIYSPILAISAIVYKIHVESALLALAAAVLIVPATFICSVKLLSPKAKLYGNARFAKLTEMLKKKIFDTNPYSILVGVYKGRKIAFNGGLHCFLAAMTESGKTVSFTIPNLLNWGGSLICLDIKRECYDLTSRFRQDALKNQVFIFNPVDDKTHCFNPFDFISTGEKSISEVQRLASTVVSIDDEYWDNKARQLFTGIALMLHEQAPFLKLAKSIGQILHLLGTPGGLKNRLEAYLEACEGGPDHPLSLECRTLLVSFCNEEDRPRESIVSSLSKHLDLWLDPRISRATSRSDFDLATFRHKKVSLYLVCSPTDLERLNTLFRMLLETFVAVNTKPGVQPGQDPKVKEQVLLLLDEFVQLGRMTRLVKSLAYVRGWGIKIATIIQSPNQLKDLYGAELSNYYEENHRCSIMFRPNRMSNQRIQEMSDAIGPITTTSKSKSRARFLTNNTGNQGSVSHSQVKRNLVTPDEIRDMPDSREFVFIDGLRPIYAHKLYYYKFKQYRKAVKMGACPLPDSAKPATISTPGPIIRKDTLVDVIRRIIIPRKAESFTETELDTISKAFCDAIIRDL